MFPHKQTIFKFCYNIIVTVINNLILMLKPNAYSIFIRLSVQYIDHSLF